ncbi:MAG: MoaD/ThiS family protein [Pirellulaceae bacterium]|nr:MoaD/ThiS family protein [Pirellulaceae bacterium]
MLIHLKIPSRFSRFAHGDHEFSLHVETMEQLLEDVCQQNPELRSRLLNEAGSLWPYFAVLHNSQRLSCEGLSNLNLSHEDTIEIMTLVSGG